MVVNEYQAVGVHTSFPVEQRKLVYSRRELVGRNFDGSFSAVVKLDVIIGFRYTVVHDLKAHGRFRVLEAGGLDGGADDLPLLYDSHGAALLGRFGQCIHVIISFVSEYGFIFLSGRYVR